MGDGRISYTVDATLYKEGLFKSDQKVSAPITVANAVAISHPSLQQPRSKDIRKTLCCLCCASGPIVITATVPCTGYCVGHDSIPLEVTVENGSSRTVRQLTAAISKRVICRSDGGHTQFYNTTVASIASNQPIAPHTTLVWNPETFEVPYVETTLDNCAILTISYFLKICGAIGYAIDPTIEIPLVLGNMPLAT